MFSSCIEIRHRPKRRYRCLNQRKKQPSIDHDEHHQRVQSTLTEFGQRNDPIVHSSVDSSDNQNKLVDNNEQAIVHDRVTHNYIRRMFNMRLVVYRCRIEIFSRK
jgi:hypothetical protein